MKKNNLMVAIAFISIFLLLLLLITLSEDYVPKNEVRELGIDDFDFDDVSFPSEETEQEMHMQPNKEDFELPLSKVVKDSDPLIFDNNDGDGGNSEPPEDCPDCPPLLSSGRGGSYSGVQFFIGQTCVQNNCNSGCKGIGFDEGKCLNNICFCLDLKENQVCYDETCAESCPTGQGSCSYGQCVCTGKYKQINCRTYGNESITNYGTILYYVDKNFYLARTYNYCQGNNLIQTFCNENSLKLSTLDNPSSDELKNSILSYNTTDCSKIFCGDGIKVGMCENADCVCRYDVSKDFVQDAITNFLMNPDTKLTNDNLSMLTRAHLNPESFTEASDEETQLGKLIQLVKDEISSSKLKINYRLLY